MRDAQPITGCRPGDVAAHVFLCGDPARVGRISAAWTKRHEVCQVREYRIVTGELAGIMGGCPVGLGRIARILD